MEQIPEITDGSFEREVLQAPQPVLLDLWAPWCRLCKALDPIVQEIARTYAGRLKVVSMNIDENPQTATRYGVRGVPNLFIFKRGNVYEQLIGSKSKAQLVKVVEGALA